jgi:hypothetical protein
MDSIKLALEMNRLVHNECKDVPHDIGLRLLDIVRNNTDTDMQEFAEWCVSSKHFYNWVSSNYVFPLTSQLQQQWEIETGRRKA